MWKKVRDYIREQGMIAPGDAVIVALSGGADSVCLLAVLKRIADGGSFRRTAGKTDNAGAPGNAAPVFALRAVHVHHGIRGAEADRDELFARALCESFSVPFSAVHCQVPSYASEHGLSEEEAGRLLRYQALEEAAVKWEQELLAGSQVKLALAHHRDDNAETILHHLLRGSGLTGLAGIRPVQGRRIRPLLCVGRDEIREYLRSERMDWCEDSTNQSADYTRNRIRSQVLPLLKETVNGQAEEHILQAGQIIGQADEYLRQQAAEIWRAEVCGQQTEKIRRAEVCGQQAEKNRRGAVCGQQAEKTRSGTVCEQQEGSESRESGTGAKREADGAGPPDRVEIPLAVFAKQPEILKTYLIRHMLDQLHPGWKDITSRHFTAIAKLAEKPVGSRIDLPGGLTAQTGYETLEIVQKAGQRSLFGEDSGRNDSLTGNRAASGLCMTIFSRQKDQEIPKNQYTKWFDYDKIKGTLSVRTRRPGDYLSLPSGGRKTIARFMIDEKIPKEKRDQILLLAEENHVLWVVGYRISEYYKIEEQTENILQVTCDGGKDYGR